MNPLHLMQEFVLVPEESWWLNQYWLLPLGGLLLLAAGFLGIRYLIHRRRTRPKDAVPGSATDSKEMAQEISEIYGKVESILQLLNQEKNSRESIRQKDIVEKSNLEVQIANLKGEKDILQTQLTQAQLGLSDLMAEHETAKERYQTDKSSFERAQSDIARYRSLAVELEEGGEEAVHAFAESLLPIERAISGIGRAFADFDASLQTGAPGSLTFCASGDQAIIDWLLSRHRELTEFSQMRISAAPAIVGPRAGHIVSGSIAVADMTSKLFSEIVRSQIGDLLRRLQRFYIFPQWAGMSFSADGHAEALHALRGHERDLIAALSRLGIKPLKLEFLKPITADVERFVSLRKLEVKTIYPAWDGLAPLGALLDVQTWGFLDMKDSLMADQRARVVVSQ
jgi:hypothetical protein